MVPIEAAKSTIGWFKSVAVIATEAGSCEDRARVTTPVPAATSSTAEGSTETTRAARSSAYGWKISGTR